MDPTLWLDHRGNLHVVANWGWQGMDCAVGELGAHAFSEDGRTWHSFCAGNPADSPQLSLAAIYNSTTAFDDGSVRQLHYERPKIILDPNTHRPTALFASVGSHCSNVTDDRSWTIARPIRMKIDEDSVSVAAVSVRYMYSGATKRGGAYTLGDAIRASF